MSWYATDLVKCYRCGKRFSTPVDLLEHKKRCLVHRSADGYIIVKIGTHGSCAAKTRHVVEVGRIIHLTCLDGTKLWTKVSFINESAVFLEVSDPPYTRRSSSS